MHRHVTGMITRIVKNSASCKSWAIPFVSAILMLAMEKNIMPRNTAYMLFVCSTYWTVIILVLNASSKTANTALLLNSTEAKIQVKTSISPIVLMK